MKICPIWFNRYGDYDMINRFISFGSKFNYETMMLEIPDNVYEYCKENLLITGSFIRWYEDQLTSKEPQCLTIP